MNRKWQSGIAGLLIAAMAIAAGAETVGDLRKKAAPVQVGPAQPVDAAKVREAYRRFLELNAGDPEMRAEALRRLADLELESADAERGDGTTAAAGGEQTRAAIALYERLLAEAPDHPRIDSVLYQLDVCSSDLWSRSTQTAATSRKLIFVAAKSFSAPDAGRRRKSPMRQ
ncbi:MAG: hypothetical protein HW392_1078 [Steroidobacteraceae bacterium]|nr:hypothetical protein [Steroidobacteraceae bacterium]